MRASFFGLNIAMQGLYTSQKALDITNHNINNVNTPGYSRQVGDQKASRPMGLYDGTGMIGTGAEITSVNRVRDDFLDFKFWSENIAYGEWDTKRIAMEELEAVFNEPSDSGFTTVIDDFYAGLQELSKDPSNEATRALVKQTGVSITKYFNTTASRIQKLIKNNNDAVKMKAEEINSYAHQIRDINELIYKAELDGNVANDLRDQRTLLVDELSKIVDIQASEVVVGNLQTGQEDRRFQVTLNGAFLVNHFNSSDLEVYENTDNVYGVRWLDSQNELNPKGGELKAYMDVRDGDGSSGQYKGLPFYMEKMNTFARNFAKAFNEGIMRNGQKEYAGHAGGIGLDGSTGIRFFSFDDQSTADFMATGTTVDARYDKMTAANITISSDIADDILKIAAASVGGEPGNNGNVDELIDLRHDSSMFAEGTAEDYLKSLIATMGIDAQQAIRMSDNQENIINQIENNRLSISGVSIDEEMANMVKFQQAYNASAKMIAVINEIYDVTINGLGL